MKTQRQLLKDFYEKEVMKNEVKSGRRFLDLTGNEVLKMEKTFSFQSYLVKNSLKNLKDDFSIKNEFNKHWNLGFSSGMLIGAVVGFLSCAVGFLIAMYVITPY